MEDHKQHMADDHSKHNQSKDPGHSQHSGMDHSMHNMEDHSAHMAHHGQPASVKQEMLHEAHSAHAGHGESGGGDGVFADDLAAAGEASMQSMNGSMEMAMQTPANFTDAKRMLGASPALLEGKILRGGMGTGMPMWGSIFTADQIQDLIAYIYSFQFEYQK